MVQQMPTAGVLALLRAAGPGRAAATLVAMPADRVAVLLAALTSAELGPMLAAASTADRDRLVAAMSPAVAVGVLGSMAPEQVARVLTPMSAPRAWQMLAGQPLSVVANALLAVPNSARARLEAAVPSELRTGLRTALYEQQVVNSLRRIVDGVSRLPGDACDLVMEIFGRHVQASVRYRGGGSMDEFEVSAAATAADWQRIGGLAVITDTPVTDGAQRYAGAVQVAGYPFALLRWVTEGDTNALKRALVRLAS